MGSASADEAPGASAADPLVMVTVRVPRSLRDGFNAYAEKRGRSVASILRSAMERATEAQ